MAGRDLCFLGRAAPGSPLAFSLPWPHSRRNCLIGNISTMLMNSVSRLPSLPSLSSLSSLPSLPVRLAQLPAATLTGRHTLGQRPDPSYRLPHGGYISRCPKNQDERHPTTTTTAAITTSADLPRRLLDLCLPTYNLVYSSDPSNDTAICKMTNDR